MSFCDNQSIKMLSFGDGKLRKEETDKDELIKKLPVKRVKSNLFGLSSESRLNEVNIRIERFWRTLKRECVYLNPVDTVCQMRNEIARYICTITQRDLIKAPTIGCLQNSIPKNLSIN